MNIISYLFKNKKVISIELENKPVQSTKDFETYTLLYCDDNVIGINIFDEKLTSLYGLGLIYCDKQFIDLVLKLTKIDLSKYQQNLIYCAKILDLVPVEGTHLNYCDVQVSKDKVLKIICGAKNARKGLNVVCATDNVLLPTGNRIVFSKVMNKESFGMLCSFKELNLLDHHSEGIIELQDKNEDKLYSVFDLVYVNLKDNKEYGI